MNPGGKNLLIVLLVGVDAVALALLVVEGMDRFGTSLQLHAVASGAAFFWHLLGSGRGAGFASRLAVAFAAGFTAWFVPVLGLLMGLFYDHERPGAIGGGAASRIFWKLGNPVADRGRADRLSEDDLAGFVPAADFVFRQGDPLSEEGMRALFRGPSAGNFLVLRRLSEKAGGRLGALAQAGTQAELDRTCRLTRRLDEWAAAAEEKQVATPFLAAEGWYSQVVRGLKSGAPDDGSLRRAETHLRRLVDADAIDELVINRLVDVLLVRGELDTAYQLVMAQSIVDEVPVRLQLARIRAAQGQWTGMRDFVKEIAPEDWDRLDPACRRFWGIARGGKGGASAAT